MSWFRVDDLFFRHPKAIRAGVMGRAFFLACGCYASNQLSDGLIEASVLSLIAAEAGVSNPKKVAELLVNIGLFERSGSDYIIHDFLIYNRSRSDVLAEREAAKERMYRVRSRVVRANEQPNIGRSSGNVRPTPTRPDPTRPLPDPSLTTTTAGDMPREPVLEVSPGGGLSSSGGEGVYPGVAGESVTAAVFVAQTLAANPAWRTELDRISAKAKLRTRGGLPAYQRGVLERWLRGDGTPGMVIDSSSAAAVVSLSPHAQRMAEGSVEIEAWRRETKQQIREAKGIN